MRPYKGYKGFIRLILPQNEKNTKKMQKSIFQPAKAVITSSFHEYFALFIVKLVNNKTK